MNGYMICKAKDKGYYVMHHGVTRYEDTAILCAGALDECLIYIKDRMKEST